MEIYWAALAIHLLVTLYLIWRVDTLYKLILAQLVLNASLVEFAETTSEEMGNVIDDIMDLQDQVDGITKTPATS